MQTLKNPYTTITCGIGDKLKVKNKQPVDCLQTFNKGSIILLFHK